VIRADEHFILLAPPSGRLEDENCCKNGIKGKFVEKDMILNVPVSQGPIDGKMSVEKFGMFSNEYRKRNFPTTDNVIEFPPFSCIQDDAVKKTAKLFSNFLSTRKGLRAVVWNADSRKYFKRIPHSISLPQIPGNSSNRVMVYDDLTASILNVRVIQNLGDMYDGMQQTVHDLKCIVASHKRLNPSLYCLGILCFPNTSRLEVESQMKFFYSTDDFQYAKLCYVCEEDFSNLEKWWKDAFQTELNRLEDIYQCKTHHTKPNNHSFGDVLSECLATIAMTNTSTTPTLKEDAHLQIKTLLLNADQIEAIEHKSKRKLILGSYGCGE